MPLLTITSPRTGKSYQIHGDGNPTPEDIDEIGQHLDNQAAKQAGIDPALLDQGPVETVWQGIKNVGPAMADMAAGGLRYLDKGAEVISQATGLERGGLFGNMARPLEGIKDEGDLLRPQNPFNPTASSIGQGVAQGIGLIGTAAASVPALGARGLVAVPAVLGFGGGAGQGLDTAEQMGITSPAGQLGMGTAFGGIEAATEAIGGIGGRFLPPLKGLPGALMGMASETLEEPLAGTLQDAVTAGVGQTMSDPAKPGFTRSGFELPKLDQQFLERRKQEAIGGAAGGVVFGGLQMLSPHELPPNQTPGTPPPTGAAPDQSPPGLAGTPGLEEHTGDLTADEVAQHFPTTGTATAQTSTGSNVQTGTDLSSEATRRTEMPVPPPTADAGAEAGATRTVPAFQDNPLAQRPATQGDVITDLRIPRSPQAIAESQRIEQERLAQQARLRSIDAKAGRGPLIPDSPLGVYDILDFVNENRIRMPKAGEATDANYDWAETYSIPKYYRQFLGNTERGAHIDQVAQAAFDNHFIAEPTADALMAAVQQAIQTRKQYRVELRKQQAEQQVAADRAQDFEKTQGKLRSKDQERVAFEQLTKGDHLTIDGEDVQVADVNYDEDGYLTNVVLEDGKRFGVMQFDPQQRGGLFVDEWQPKGEALPPLMNRTADSQITSVAAQAADVAHGRAWGPMSPSLRQSMFRAPTTSGQAPPAQAGTSGARGVAKLFSMPEGSAGTPARNAEADRSVRAPLAQAYQQAAQGQSTAFLPIAAVWQQAQAQNPALTPEDFVDEVMRQYNESTVMLEGANTQQEANEAGMAIHHTPVGSAVRMVVVGDQQGSALQPLQNPASGATGAPMASDFGAAQNAEPSPGGLSEADAEYLAAVEAGDMKTAQRMVDERVARWGAENKQTQEIVQFESQAELKTFLDAQPKGLWTMLYPQSLIRLRISLALAAVKPSFINTKTEVFNIDGVPYQASLNKLNADELKLNKGIDYPIQELLIENVRTGYGKDDNAFGVTGTMGTRGAIKFIREAERIASGTAKKFSLLGRGGLIVRANEENRARLYSRIFDTLESRFDGVFFRGMVDQFSVFGFIPSGVSSNNEARNVAGLLKTKGFQVVDKLYDAPVIRNKGGDIIPLSERFSVNPESSRAAGGTSESLMNPARNAKLLASLPADVRAAAERSVSTGAVSAADASLLQQSDVASLVDTADEAAVDNLRDLLGVADASYDAQNAAGAATVDQAFAQRATLKALAEQVHRTKQLSAADEQWLRDNAPMYVGKTSADTVRKVSSFYLNTLESPASLAANQKANEAILQNLGLPTAKGTRIWGGAKIKGALLKLSTDMRYPATTRFMARELAALKLENLLLKIEADARLNWAGLYQPFTDGRGELSLNTRTLGRGELDIGVSLVHEVLHHATYQALRTPKTARQKQAKADLEALFKRAKAALAANEKLSAFDYELSNLDEFITGLFTRADFQSALADIPADAAPTLGQRFRSVLDEIFRVLAEIVTGKPVPVGSVLEASMAAALRIMQDGRTQAAHELQPLMNPSGDTRNQTQSRFASPNAADRVINGPRTNELVAQEAQRWLEGLDTEAAIELFVSQQVPLSDAAEYAAAMLLSRLSAQATQGKTEVARMWAHVQGQRMARVWTREYLSADPARALRQRGVVNNGILAPIAPILAVQQLLTDRATKVIDARYNGGAEGVTERVREVADDADAQASDALADALASELDEPADVPELGEAPLPPEPQTTPGRDARLVELEAKLKEMRERLHVADAEMQHRTTLWQKILDMLNSAKSKQSTVLTTVKAKAAAARAAAKTRMAQRRSEGRLNTTPAADFADEVIIGASLIAEGIVDLANWSQAMVRELGARSKLQLDRLYTAALQQHYEDLKAEIEKTPEEPSTPRQPRTPREKITKAQRTAQSILDELSRRYADPPIFAEGQRKVNLMRELYKEHVRTPMAEAVFVQRAKQLGANEGTAGILWEAATLEINAREMMRLEKAHAKRFPFLKQNSPALHKLLNTLRAKMYPGMKWADIFAQLPATQKQRQLAIYQRLMKDDRLQGLNTAERLLLTNELDKAWQRERRKVFMRELKKAGILGEKKPVDREKVQAAAPRLLRLMNLGMLNSEMFREALAKEYGLKMIDAATAGELRALGEKIQTAPDGLPRRKLEQRLVEKLQNLAGTTFWQVMDSWWTASVLSGWRTQVDIGLGIANGIEDVGLGGIVAALRTGNKDVAVRGLANLFGRIPSAFMEAVDHVRTGNKAMMRNFELEARQAMENGNRLASDVGAQMWRTGGWRKVPGAFMIFYGRLLTALDHVNSASTREGAKALALARHPELYQRALRISDADRQAARQQARLELTAGAAPTTQQQRLEENARIREILEQSIPTEVLDDATNIGRAAALQGDPSGLGGGLLDMVNAAVGIVARKAEAMSKRENLDPKSQQVLKLLQGTAPLMRAITGTKFARTVSHALNRTLSYVPAVGVYAVGQQGRTGPFGDVLAAKQVIGTLVGLALYLSFDDDKDEKGIEDGWKDKTPQEKAQLYAQGKQPYTIWQRDAQGRVRAYNYQQWGVAGIVNTVAAMLKQKHSEAGTINVLLSSLIQGGMSFTDKAQLQGLQTVFGDNSRSTDPASNLASRLNKWGAQTVGGVVPRLLKDIDAVASPELRTSSDWWQKWAREVPMVRELTAGKRIDILGGDILLDRSPLSRVRSIGTADPAYRLLGLLNSKDLYLPDPSQGVAVVRLADGTRRAMTTQEKDRYQRLVGKAYRQFILEQGQRLLTLDPEKAKDDIRRITDNLRRIARVQAVQR